MLAVLDPNVLVSAAISTAGQPRQIINAWVDGRFELLASPALIDELTDVLARAGGADSLVSGDRHLTALTTTP